MAPRTLGLMDKSIERMAIEAGISSVVDLRRHDAGPALERFAALVAERCAWIAEGLPLESSPTLDDKNSPLDLGTQIGEAIRVAFRCRDTAADEALPRRTAA